MNKPMQTSIATSTASTITYRDQDLVNDVIGKVDFTAMIYRHLSDRYPTPQEAALLDACLVTLMEHGLTPSSLVARLITDSVPGELQVAVAAGLNAVGSVFVGTMEGCGRLLKALDASDEPKQLAETIVREHLDAKRPLPGFGHPFHKPDDPRTPILLNLARSQSLHRGYCEALLLLSEKLDAIAGRHLTINATGAVAALLLEAGLDPDIFRGIAVISRSAGLVGHIQEERQKPIARRLWILAEENTEFLGG